MTDYPLQRIRRVYESAVEDALAYLPAPAITVYTDNEYYAEKKANSEFALVRLSFGEMHELTIGGIMERIRGSLVVEIYTPKGKGPGRAQIASEAVLRGLAKLNQGLPDPSSDIIARIGPVTGPRLTPLQSAPHFMARLSCGISASYHGTPE